MLQGKKNGFWIKEKSGAALPKLVELIKAESEC